MSTNFNYHLYCMNNAFNFTNLNKLITNLLYMFDQDMRERVHLINMNPCMAYLEYGPIYCFREGKNKRNLATKKLNCRIVETDS